jgi:outer membrane immunogenic protein
MKAITLGGAMLSLMTVGAFGADLGPVMPLAAAPALPPFTWTGCYAGGHIGGAMARNSITDPVLLVQDTAIGPGTTVGVTTVTNSPGGVVIGGQFGCDYEFASRWVVGIEGAVSGATLKGNTTIGFPAGAPGDNAVVSAKTDFLPSVTARVGYDFGRLLAYVRGGAAWAGEQYNVIGTITVPPPTAVSFQGINTFGGWTVGAGVDWAFWGPWSASLEYGYYKFGGGNVVMTDSINGFVGAVNTSQSIQVVKLGLNFHVWADEP